MCRFDGFTTETQVQPLVGHAAPDRTDHEFAAFGKSGGIDGGSAGSLGTIPYPSDQPHVSLSRQKLESRVSMNDGGSRDGRERWQEVSERIGVADDIGELEVVRHGPVRGTVNPYEKGSERHYGKKYPSPVLS
jgi:hypothetical protein